MLCLALVVLIGCATGETRKLHLGMTTQRVYDMMGAHTTGKTLDYKGEWADLWIYERNPPEKSFEILFLNDHLIKWNYSNSK